jgi:hypothetical protein
MPQRAPRAASRYEVGRPCKPILGPKETKVCVDTFRRTGFTGGINWYRNIARNCRRAAADLDHVVRVPGLMITAELDSVLPPSAASRARQGSRDAAGKARRGQRDDPRLAPEAFRMILMYRLAGSKRRSIEQSIRFSVKTISRICRLGKPRRSQSSTLEAPPRLRP